jgi:hypothetical protein
LWVWPLVRQKLAFLGNHIFSRTTRDQTNERRNKQRNHLEWNRVNWRIKRISRRDVFWMKIHDLFSSWRKSCSSCYYSSLLKEGCFTSQPLLLIKATKMDFPLTDQPCFAQRHSLSKDWDSIEW